MDIRNTSFVQDGAAGRRVTRWWAAYLVTFGLMLFVIQFGVLGAMRISWTVPDGSPLQLGAWVAILLRR